MEITGTTLAVLLSARAPGTAGERDFGHVWLSTGERPATASRPRGFYPTRSSLPESIFRDKELFKRFFFEHEVPGEIQRDVQALVLSRFYPLSSDSFAYSCVLLRRESTEYYLHETYIAEQDTGRDAHASYSLNLDAFPNAHNCSTWACSLLNTALRSERFPAREIYVRKLILFLQTEGHQNGE